MIKAVIIDFDDTLCLTEDACFALENEILALMGAKTQTREMHQKTWGQPLFEAIKVRSPGVDADKFKQLVQENIPFWVAENRMDSIPVERLQVLDDLLAAGKELFILTSRTHAELKHILAPDHHLAKRIKAFYYRDIMQFHKPDPRAFDLLLDGHKLQRHECVYVGDSPSDAAAAKQAKMHFIASLESGLRNKADFKDYAVDVFIGHLQDLPQATSRLR
ncbi:MAG: HAD family hydrolase [Candidatus Saccharimonadales bacterium]